MPNPFKVRRRTRYNRTRNGTFDRKTNALTNTTRQITRSDMRKLAITRQYLDKTPPPQIDDLVHQLGCVQLDPISAVERSHLVVLWSRYNNKVEEATLTAALWGDKTLFEYWAHAASIVSTRDYPVHAWYMRRTQAEDAKWQASLKEKGTEGLDRYVLDQLRENGPMLSRDIEDHSERYEHVWWSGRHVPRVLQHLWTRGDVMIVGREGKQRLWGLTDDFLPDSVDRSVWKDDRITRVAAARAIRALGTATPKQIRYHFTRGRYPNLSLVLDDMVRTGEIERVEITENGELLSGAWYIHADDVSLADAVARGEFAPRTTLLSPFDNLICDRDRTELLWDFYFRIEIYVPKAKREYGYYVLPILHGDELVGRIDPKFDRKTSTLHIYNVYREPKSPRNKRMLKQIRTAVESLGAFLGAKTIEWGTIPDEWTALRP